MQCMSAQLMAIRLSWWEVAYTEDSTLCCSCYRSEEQAGYQELVNAIIRPPRARYEVEALGPVEFEFLGKAFKRLDFRLLNDRGHVLECSHWQPNGWRRAERLPCVVYMHGNSSARVEALPQLSLALSLGATLVSFDFAGSGRSGGEHVSLGYYERDDLKAVIEHLRKSGQVSTIALWGRSMGAATALLHGDRDPSIAALVLDSAFADLTQLAEEMVERGRQAGLTVPGIVVKMVMRMIRGTVTKTANFNVRDLCPIKHANRTFIPALFVAGLADDFIKPHHSKQICEAYAGDKNFVTVDGDHNSPRPGFLFDSVYIFLQRYLQVPPEWGLDRENTVMGVPPWHFASGGSGMSAAAAAAMFGAAAAASGEGSGDLDYADYDWDGIGLGGIGVDGAPSVGMTRARQAEFQTALFHMLAQERTDQAPEETPGGGGDERRSPAVAAAGAGAAETAAVEAAAAAEAAGAAAAGAAAGGRDSSMTDSRSQSSIASPRAVHASGAVVVKGAGGHGQGESGVDVVEMRECELLPQGTFREEESLTEEEEQGAEAVAAVAAALRVGGTPNAAAATGQQWPRPFEAATTTAAMASTTTASGFATPSSGARPAMAPFSVSDTSDFEDLEEDDDDEGGVEGLAEFMAAKSAAAGGPVDSPGNGFATPLSSDSKCGGGREDFFDAEGSGGALSVGKGTAERVLDWNANGGLLERGGEGGHGDRDVLSGDRADWKRTAGVVGSMCGEGGADNEATSAEGLKRVVDGGGLVAKYTDVEWSCSKCTLKNIAAAKICLVCASPREDE
ncbi:conserved unknown protein [Ectocarpus siliculosus]|uniref:RanBP2-type domain-containing protein n=1 Tax=Ectocarpus siliculosus TaxID=2880 RepID=D7FM32_ECTSI|nr:conserved unknown protein [Ectocarpus siliculosus]|eukprot:CBJ29857.1 conserved unknown protein [Ectocarpus siliculosus]